MDSSESGTGRPVVKSRCPHIFILSPALCWEEIHRRQADQPECDSCAVKGANLWLCLARGCSNIGCGISAQHHSLEHGKEFHHYLTINLTTRRLWCFSCEKEVFPGFNSPPLNIPEVVAASTLKSMAHCESSSNSSPQRSTSGAEDSDSDLDDENSRPRGLTGLSNMGNTCYLNSAVQALSNCPPLTRFFLDCQGYVRPERSPMLSKSYAKLISELWHKKRPSYVVPTGIVSGIKVVHPMFRGFTQQDAQEFLRCFMDQLHEELKYPVVISEEEDADDEDDDDSDKGGHHKIVDNDPESGIASPTDPGAQSLAGSLGGGDSSRRRVVAHERQNSVDSSISDGEYETCDSGLSSEMGSQADPSLSSDDNSEINEQTLCLPINRGNDNRGGEKCQGEKMVTMVVRGPSPHQLAPPTTTTSPTSFIPHRQNKNRNSFSSGIEGEGIDTVANLKEIKETANLLSKIETDKARNQGLVKSESGEYLDALSDSTTVTTPPAANTRSKTAAALSSQQQQHHQHFQQQQRPQPVYQEVAAATSIVPTCVKQTSIPHKSRKRKNIQYESVISHIFDGKILSSVQCLYCERVSTTKETFQDLSLPIPSKDYLQVLHSGHPSLAPGGGAGASGGGASGSGGGGAMGGPRGGACGDQLGTQSWFSWVFSWMKSFFVGPTITLRDCLSAFFSADELKGDNMYSCEQCKKLRNGLKYSKVLELPEVLTIHLKRFRHEFFSSKINTYISFPLHNLDMKPYLHKDCKSEVTLYDLVGVVCHHGTAGGGHYTAYCLNRSNDQWYEYDDMYVTEVDLSQVINCEAYVLFYRKTDEHMHNVRMKAMKMKESNEPSLMKFYVSKQWINKFNTFAEPGPISNRDFLCRHGGVPPHKVSHVEELVQPLGQNVWELLYSRFGGGPVCNRLYPCPACQEELDMIKAGQKWQLESFIALNKEYMSGEVHYPVIYALSMAWFRQWETFVKTKSDNVFLLVPPGPIDNSCIMVYRNGQAQLRPASDYGQLSPDMWHFLHGIYGGGPEVIIRQKIPMAASSSHSSSSSASASVSASSVSSVSKETGIMASNSTTSAATTTTPSPTPSPPLTTHSSSPASSASSSPPRLSLTVAASEDSSVPATEEWQQQHSAAAAGMLTSSSGSCPLVGHQQGATSALPLIQHHHSSSSSSSSSVSTSTLTPTPTMPKTQSEDDDVDEDDDDDDDDDDDYDKGKESVVIMKGEQRPPSPSENTATATTNSALTKASAMSDSGDSMEDEGSRLGSGLKSQGVTGCVRLSGVGTIHEVKGIPQSMDVTRL